MLSSPQSSSCLSLKPFRSVVVVYAPIAQNQLNDDGRPIFFISEKDTNRQNVDKQAERQTDRPMNIKKDKRQKENNGYVGTERFRS